MGRNRSREGWRDERRAVAISSQHTLPSQPPRRTVPLDEAEALRLLGTVSIGRLAFTRKALPAIRPVNHLVDGGVVVIRSHDGAAVVPAPLPQAVVAYQADQLDPVARTGWSVIVTGIARRLRDPERVEHYRQRVRAWVADDLDQVFTIEPNIITGVRLVDG